jgi:general secretion pathway protein G
MRNPRSRGFTLIELLVVIGIIGILVAMATINYMSALNKARQKKTMADIRTIAAAWEARAADVRGYNAAGAFSYPAAALDSTTLSSMLIPNYARALPMKDAWGTPFEFAVDVAASAGSASRYAIRSAGRDRVFESAAYEPGQTTDFDRDVVFSNGTFIVYPGN